MNTGKHDHVDKPYLQGDFARTEVQLGHALCDTPIPVSALAENSGLLVSPRTIKRQFVFDEIHKPALPVHGGAMQLGVRWTRELDTFERLPPGGHARDCAERSSQKNTHAGLDSVRLQRAPLYSGHESYFLVKQPEQSC